MQTKTFTENFLVPMGGKDAGRLIAAKLAANISVIAGTALGMITGATQNEQQTLTVTGSAGVINIPIVTPTGTVLVTGAYNVAAATLQASLNAASNLAGGTFTVALSGGVYTMTWTGAFAGMGQPLLGAYGTGGATVVTARTQAGRTQYTLSPYNSGNSDGTQALHSLAAYDMSSDIYGNQFQGVVAYGDGAGLKNGNVFIAGPFNAVDLTGVDAAGLSGRGILESGSISGPGTVRLF